MRSQCEPALGPAVYLSSNLGDHLGILGGAGDRQDLVIFWSKS